MNLTWSQYGYNQLASLSRINSCSFSNIVFKNDATSIMLQGSKRILTPPTVQVDEVYEDGESLTLEQTNKLVYLEQCIKETLRIHPPAQATLRVNWNEDVTVDNLFIPKGW